MRIGRKLFAYRKHHGLSQIALAERLDVDERVLRRWERGDVEPSGKHLRLIQPILAPFDTAYTTIIHYVNSSGGKDVAIDMNGILHGISSEARKYIEPFYNTTLGQECIPIPQELIERHRQVVLDELAYSFTSTYTEQYDGSTMLTTSNGRIIRDISIPLVVWSYSTEEVDRELIVPHELVATKIFD